jgi:hypothetical protein
MEHSIILGELLIDFTQCHTYGWKRLTTLLTPEEPSAHIAVAIARSGGSVQFISVARVAY